MIGVKLFNTIFIFINYQIGLCSVGITVSTISGYMKVSNQGDWFESRSGQKPIFRMGVMKGKNAR